MAFTQSFGVQPKKVEVPVEVKKEVPVKDSKGVNKEVWAEAEHNVRSTGGLGGRSVEGKKRLIQEQYDQMVANDKKLKEGFSDILGDV